MPFIVLLAWWIGKPFHMLFGMYSSIPMKLPANPSPFLDLYEVAVLVGSAFLVNYITSDAKTNWVRRLSLGNPFAV